MPETQSNDSEGERTPFEKFQSLASRLFSVSKEEQEEALRKEAESGKKDENHSSQSQ